MGPLYSEGSLEVKEGGRREGQSDVKYWEKNLTYHCSLYNEGRGKETRNTGSLEKLVKARKWIPPRASRKRHSPADTLILAPWELCQISNLHNCKIIHLCCFKAFELVVICYTSSRKRTQTNRKLIKYLKTLKKCQVHNELIN